MQFTDEELALIAMSLSLTGHLATGGSDAETGEMVRESKYHLPAIDGLLGKIVPHVHQRVAHLEALAELVKNGKPQ